LLDRFAGATVRIPRHAHSIFASSPQHDCARGALLPPHRGIESITWMQRIAGRNVEQTEDVIHSQPAFAS